jgi:glutamate racemase
MSQQTQHTLNPIGMFDSGVGGLTVLRQIMALMPQEKILYFGDTARMPYGDKSHEAVTQYAIENTAFLLDQRIKLLIVACSTASAHAMHRLRELFDVPMIDVVEAGVNQVVAATKNQRIAILGTKGTICSAVYQKEILKRLPEATLFPIACPLLAPIVEENFAAHSAARLIVREYLVQLKNSSIDTLLLGCTHYPLLMPFIQEELPHVMIIDPAACCASMAASLLCRFNLKSDLSLSKPVHSFYVSSDPQKFSHFASHFLGTQVPCVEILP